MRDMGGLSSVATTSWRNSNSYLLEIRAFHTAKALLIFVVKNMTVCKKNWTEELM